MGASRPLCICIRIGVLPCQLLVLPAQGREQERKMASTPAEGRWLLSADPGERGGQMVTVLCGFPASQMRRWLYVSPSPTPPQGHVNFGFLVFIRIFWNHGQLKPTSPAHPSLFYSCVLFTQNTSLFIFCLFHIKLQDCQRQRHLCVLQCLAKCILWNCFLRG